MPNGETTVELAPPEADDRALLPCEIEIVLSQGPVSQQATRARKDVLAAELKLRLQNLPFYLTGDVQLDLEWLIHERLRYESHESADVDNVLKPILDAISGPTGVIIDDCQVQRVTSAWVDWALDEQQLSIRIRYDPEESIPRQVLAFIHLTNSLYMPVRTDASPETRNILADHFIAATRTRDTLDAYGADFHLSRSVMPIQRLFHRSRLGTGFRLGSVADYRDGFK